MHTTSSISMAMLFLGTLFATEDRDIKGEGFTHKIGDKVIIHEPKVRHID